MKTFLTTVLIATITFLSACHKADDVVTRINCDGLVTDTLGTNDNGRIFMQNAFTPNGDGRNDESRVVVYNITSLVYTVYDGNNNIVFTTNQLIAPGQNGWASSSPWAPTSNASTYETYYYKIQATTNSNHHIGICGELYKLACYPPGIPRTSLYFESMLRIDGTYDPNDREVMPTCP